MTFPLQAVPLCPYYTEAIFVRGVGGRGALVLCVSVQGGGWGREQGGDRVSL